MFGGKKGVGCGLGPVQKVADGEPLGGGAPKAGDVFGTIGGQTQTQAQPKGFDPITGQPIY